MRWVAIPFDLYNEVFENVKIGKDNTVTSELRSSRKDKKKVKGKIIEGDLAKKRQTLLDFCGY